MKSSRHLDIGCGPQARNPYGCNEVYGVDLASRPDTPKHFFRSANLAMEPIPFEDNFFSSVSAYDFLEHMPRLLSNGVDSTRSPFIALMNEIWRVLEPNGRFYAVTPAYPRIEAFSDPTHVNIITEETHLYFTEPQVWAKMYGFTGSFKLVRVEWMRKKADYEPINPCFRDKLRKLADKMMKRQAHLLWDFAAAKS